MAAVVRGPLADYHHSQGATLSEYHGALVPARFSVPLAEYAAVRQAAGLFDFSCRAKFAVRGADRERFLQGMVTNDVAKLGASQGVYAALLNPHGHLLADLRVYREREAYLIDIDADLLTKALAILQRYIIRDQVELTALHLFALAFEGPHARALLEKTLHIDIPSLNEFDHFAANYGGFPIRVVRASSTGEEGYEVWASAPGTVAVWAAACGQAPTYDMLPCGTEALEMLRIEAGIARYGADFGEDTLLPEAALWNAVSFTKGCYVGQEIVARIHSQGQVNWMLIGLAAETAEPLRTSLKLFSAKKEVGEITSACFSPCLQKPFALAYARREVSEPGTKLSLASGATVTVTALPFYRRRVRPSFNY